jgi:pectin methylesterase-like acyl-CoA thioesterase
MKILIFILFFLPYCAFAAFDVKNVIDSPMLTQKIGTNRTIKVDINGNGEFKSVQAAIDSIPEGNSNWVIIHIRQGVYRYKFFT